MIILFFYYFTHKGWKYLTILIEHIFYFIFIPFSCQNLSSIHAFVLHTNGLKVDADYTPKLCFSSQDFGSIYHNLYYNDSLSYAPFFQNSLQWSLV